MFRAIDDALAESVASDDSSSTHRPRAPSVLARKASQDVHAAKYELHNCAYKMLVRQSTGEPETCACADGLLSMMGASGVGGGGYTGS